MRTAGQGEPGRPAAIAWLIWALGAAFYAYGFFQRVAPSAMTEELMRDFAVGATALGNLSAVYFYAYASLQIPAGIALDRWGPRWILMGAAVLGALGSALFAFAEGLGFAALGRLCVGAGVAVAYIGSLKLAALWLPPDRYALLAGLLIPFGMVGAVSGQAPLGALVETAGWRGPMFGGAAFSALLALLFWLVPLLGPAKLGRVRAEPAAPAGSSLARLKRAARAPQIWVVAVVSAGLTAPILAFAGLWGVPYLVQAYGIDRSAAGAATSAMLLGWAAGAPLAGWASDRIARRKAPMILGTAILLAGWLGFILWPAPPLGAIYPLFAAIGVASGVGILGFAIVRDRVGVEASGSASAIVNTCIMGSGALVQLLLGALLDLGWEGRIESGVRIYSLEDYRSALLVLPALAGLALAVSLGLRETASPRGHGHEIG